MKFLVIARVTFKKEYEKSYIQNFEREIMDVVIERIEKLGFKEGEDFTIMGTYAVRKNHFKELEVEVIPIG